MKTPNTPKDMMVMKLWKNCFFLTSNLHKQKPCPHHPIRQKVQNLNQAAITMPQVWKHAYPALKIMGGST